MSLQSFEKYANKVIRHYNLPVKFAWIRSEQFTDSAAKMRGLGYFSPPDSTVGILKELYHADELKAKMTFLHEVAHAVRYYEYGKERTEDDIHDELFEGIAAEVGGDILEEQPYYLAKKPYYAMCSVCGCRAQVRDKSSNVLCPDCHGRYGIRSPVIFRRKKNPRIFSKDDGTYRAIESRPASDNAGQGGWFKDSAGHREAARKGADKRRLGMISALRKWKHAGKLRNRI